MSDKLFDMPYADPVRLISTGSLRSTRYSKQWQRLTQMLYQLLNPSMKNGVLGSCGGMSQVCPDFHCPTLTDVDLCMAFPSFSRIILLLWMK